MWATSPTRPSQLRRTGLLVYLLARLGCIWPYWIAYHQSRSKLKVSSKHSRPGIAQHAEAARAWILRLLAHVRSSSVTSLSLGPVSTKMQNAGHARD